MNVYADSSALVKRYIGESESERVRVLLRAPNRVAAANVAIAEVISAFNRSWRAGRLGPSVAELARARFIAEASGYTWIPIDGALAEQAGELAWRHGLRGFDATHLAAGLRWQSFMPAEETVFATFDKQLALAARAEGLNTWPDRERPGPETPA